MNLGTLSKADYVAVIVEIASGGAPRFGTGRMQNSCAGYYGASMGRFQVLDDETDLSLSRGLGRLSLVEREMQVSTVVPGMRSMSASKPAVTYHLAAPLHFVVSSLVKINAERVSIEGR